MARRTAVFGRHAGRCRCASIWGDRRRRGRRISLAALAQLAPRTPIAIASRLLAATASSQPLSMSFAFVFPGQGSQTVGMLAQLASAEPLVQETFAEASEVLGYDLWKLCQGGPEEELGKTERTQPAMLAAGVATWRVRRKHGAGLTAAMAAPRLS